LINAMAACNWPAALSCFENTFNGSLLAMEPHLPYSQSPIELVKRGRNGGLTLDYGPAKSCWPLSSAGVNQLALRLAAA
jgi:hypothetical protein